MSDIGVVMIVKNEAKVLWRALESTKDFASAWLVSDTGSDDVTWDLLTTLVKDEDRLAINATDWQDFATNRNHALDLAREQFPEVRYWLSLDADETAHLAAGAHPSCLEADLVFVEMVADNTRFWAPRLIRAQGPCRWRGRCHEIPEGGDSGERWLGLELHHHDDGHSSGGRRREARNEMLLRADLHEAPDDPRTNFYLAQDLKAAGRFKEAIPYYKRRAELGELHQEEGWYAHYMLGVSQLAVGDRTGIDTLLRALNRRPWRAEPLADLTTYYFQQGMEEVAKFFELAADSLPYPATDQLFIEDALYNHEKREALAPPSPGPLSTGRREPSGPSPVKGSRRR
jgi:glycosyltransferase involved in cell wall biosynthesis